jgi:hypothetical protein
MGGVCKGLSQKLCMLLVYRRNKPAIVPVNIPTTYRYTVGKREFKLTQGHIAVELGDEAWAAHRGVAVHRSRIQSCRTSPRKLIFCWTRFYHRYCIRKPFVKSERFQGFYSLLP